LALYAWQQAFKKPRLNNLTVQEVRGADLVLGATHCFRIRFTLEAEMVKALPGLDLTMRLGR
jgi:hypothetical protein